ncbi:MAG: hypothetical protein K2W97_09055 [Chthoniobacterales bacterium]|nr:hypothetical protein [Chthoniobacterales bacterium]
MTENHQKWRLSYNLLFRVIDAEMANKFKMSQIAEWTKEELSLPYITI